METEGRRRQGSQGLREPGTQRRRCQKTGKSVYSLAGTQVSLASKKRGLKRFGRQHADIKSVLPTARQMRYMQTKRKGADSVSPKRHLSARKEQTRGEGHFSSRHTCPPPWYPGPHPRPATDSPHLFPG